MTNGRKISALLLVGMMLMSGLVALSAPVFADTTLTGANERFDILFTDGLMYDELVYDMDPDGTYFTLGEGDGVFDHVANANTVQIDVQLTNNWPGVTAVTMNITDYNSDVFDFNDADYDTHAQIDGTIGAWAPGFPADNATATVSFTFDFDVLRTSGLGSDDDTELSMRLWYAGGGTGASGANVDFNVNIYLSSVFDDPTTATDDALGVLPMVRDMGGAGDDTRFEAGDTFEATELALHNYAGTNIDDVTCTITPPATGITFTDGINYCTVPDGVDIGNTQQLIYRTEVAADAAPGVYDGSAELVYTREDNGLTITEGPHALEWEVDFNFRDDDAMANGDKYSDYQCVATSVTIIDDGTNTRQQDFVTQYPDAIPTIEQSTYTDRKVVMNITIENNGNHPIYNVQFELDVNAGGAWDYFRNPKFYWPAVNGGVTSPDTISDTFDLAVGESRNFTIEVIVLNNIPIGEHRLPIQYTGYYFNDGSLGEATGYVPINDVNTNGVIDAGEELEVIFSIMVTDSVIACHVNGAVVTGNAGDKGIIVAETIQVTLMNDEGYGFIDVIVRANFTGTPWYMPVIGMSDPWVDANNANPAMPIAGWPALGNITPTFTVDTNPDMTPDRYPFQLEITAVIEETLEVVTVVIDYTQGAVIDFGGYGPDVYVTAFTADDIVPGEMFNLVLTLENVGDDTLRDVTVFIPVDGTLPALWDSEQIFKQQFDYSDMFSDMFVNDGTTVPATGNTFSLQGDFPEEIFYTVEDLDVDNIREIYEINLYVDGIYSRPSARIALIHIMDLAPGASTEVTFDMYTDKDMVNGKPYDMTVAITGLSSTSVTPVTFNRAITVMSSIPGTSYNPVELDWFDAGIKAMGLFLFFIIVLAILLFVYNMFKGDPYDEDEDDFDFEDDEPDFEPAPPPAPVDDSPEELVEP